MSPIRAESEERSVLTLHSLYLAVQDNREAVTLVYCFFIIFAVQVKMYIVFKIT